MSRVVRSDRSAVVTDHWTGADLFFVDDGGTRYRYRAAGRPDEFRRPVTV